MQSGYFCNNFSKYFWCVLWSLKKAINQSLIWLAWLGFMPYMSNMQHFYFHYLDTVFTISLIYNQLIVHYVSLNHLRFKNCLVVVLWPVLQIFCGWCKPVMSQIKSSYNRNSLKNRCSSVKGLLPYKIFFLTTKLVFHHVLFSVLW